jgi:hypothetical protein
MEMSGIIAARQDAAQWINASSLLWAWNYTASHSFQQLFVGHGFTTLKNVQQHCNAWKFDVCIQGMMRPNGSESSGPRARALRTARSVISKRVESSLNCIVRLSVSRVHWLRKQIWCVLNSNVGQSLCLRRRWMVRWGKPRAIKFPSIIPRSLAELKRGIGYLFLPFLIERTFPSTYMTIIWAARNENPSKESSPGLQLMEHALAATLVGFSRWVECT